MAAHRNPPAHQPPAEATVEADQATGGRDRSAPQQEPLAPRAGRTGGMGTRAERPSEDSRRQPDEKEARRRGAKAPSARGTPHSDDRSSK